MTRNDDSGRVQVETNWLGGFGPARVEAILAPAVAYERPKPSLTEFDADEIGRANGEEPPPDRPRFVVDEVGGNELAGEGAEQVGLDILPFIGSHRSPFVRGFSHVFAAPPKTGKTETMVQLVHEWGASGLRTVYITEEPRRIWQARLALIPGDWSHLRVVFGLGASAAALTDRAFGGEEDVVIFDTLRSLLPVRDENDNSLVAMNLNPVVARGRTAGKTLIFLVHERKGGGQHGEGIAGGHALLGVVDVAVELLRDPSVPTRRLLRSLSRIVTPPELLFERGEDGTFRVLGDPSAVAQVEVSRRLLGAVCDEWRTTKELHEGLGEPRPSEEQVRLTLTELARRGDAERDPPIAEGKARGPAHRWRRSKIAPT